MDSTQPLHYRLYILSLILKLQLLPYLQRFNQACNKYPVQYISPTVNPILILSVPPVSIVCCLEMSVVPEEYVPQRPKYQNPLVDR